MPHATAGNVAAPYSKRRNAMSAELIVLLAALAALIVIVTTDDFGGPA
jgi:hypothetical protein